MLMIDLPEELLVTKQLNLEQKGMSVLEKKQQFAVAGAIWLVIELS
jgi:hypothetical protein